MGLVLTAMRFVLQNSSKQFCKGNSKKGLQAHALEQLAHLKNGRVVNSNHFVPRKGMMSSGSH